MNETGKIQLVVALLYKLPAPKEQILSWLPLSKAIIAN
jgi:hypothetical protein